MTSAYISLARRMSLAIHTCKGGWEMFFFFNEETLISQKQLGF